MKKLVIVSIALFLVATSSINAQTVPADTTKTATTAPATAEATQQEKTPIKVEELPEAVKTTIAGDEYKGWTPKSASVVKGEAEFYEVILVKGEETSIVKFDKEGKKIV